MTQLKRMFSHGMALLGRAMTSGEWSIAAGDPALQSARGSQGNRRCDVECRIHVLDRHLARARSHRMSHARGSAKKPV